MRPLCPFPLPSAGSVTAVGLSAVLFAAVLSACTLETPESGPGDRDLKIRLEPMDGAIAHAQRLALYPDGTCGTDPDRCTWRIDGDGLSLVQQGLAAEGIEDLSFSGTLQGGCYTGTYTYELEELGTAVACLDPAI